MFNQVTEEKALDVAMESCYSNPVTIACWLLRRAGLGRMRVDLMADTCGKTMIKVKQMADHVRVRR